MKKYMIITKTNLLTALVAVAVFAAAILLAVRLDDIAVPVSSWRSASLPVYGVETAEKKIALTFNAAWEADDIPDLLALLAQRKVVCTFFLVGEWAETNPREARLIAEAGHEIGNHSYSHPDMTTLSAERIKADITKADEAIKQASGVFPVLFRAPSGAYNDTVIEAALSLEHTPVQWTVDSIDWKKPSADKLARRVLQKAQPGAIVLMHTGLENTREALPDIIDSLAD
ncbi:MAG: polysaccharide deacetylase family protein, partial [Acetanaerobacterium sp.]